MSVIAWIILGLIAGFIGSKIVNKTGQGFLMDVVLGIVGAVVGGFIFTFFGAAGVTGLNIYSLIVSIVGAVVVLWVYHQVADAADQCRARVEMMKSAAKPIRLQATIAKRPVVGEASNSMPTATGAAAAAIRDGAERRPTRRP